MRVEWLGFELWVELAGDEVGVVFQLNHLHQIWIGGAEGGEGEACIFQLIHIGRVELVAVAVAL